MNFKLPEIEFNLGSFTGKHLLITIAVIYTIGLCGFLIHSTLKVSSPMMSYTDTSVVNTTETGINTSCESNDDCWCKSFDGTKFIPGKTPSTCNKKTYTCAACLYR